MEDSNNLELEQPASQDGTEDTLAEILGDELGVDLTTKTESKEQSSDQVQPTGTDESDQDHSITEEQLDVLTKELGYEETDLDTIEPSDLKNILETKTAKPTQVDGSIDAAKIILTQDMVDQYAKANEGKAGIAKSFIGQPVDKLLDALVEQNKRIGKVEGELKQHQTKLTEKENQKVDELLKELKTSNDLSEEDFWKKHDDLVRLQAHAQMQAEVEKPQKAAEALAFMQAAMPKGIDFKATFDSWSQSLDPETLQHYKNTDDYAIREAVKNFALLQQKDQDILTAQQQLASVQAKKESDAKILAAKKAAAAIKSSSGQRMAGSKYHVIKRGANSNVDYGSLGETATQIYKESLED